MLTTVEIALVDVGILVVYLILSRLLPLGLTQGKQGDSSDFFLGGRTFTWPLIGFSLFATTMSSALTQYDTSVVTDEVHT